MLHPSRNTLRQSVYIVVSTTNSGRQGRPLPDPLFILLRNIMLYPRSGGRFGVLSYVRYRGEEILGELKIKAGGAMV